MDRQKVEQAVEDLLCPGGQPIGSPGRRSARVRLLPGDIREARQLFDELAGLGSPAPIPTFPGDRARIPGLGYVGLRSVSGSGEPTIDVDVKIPSLRGIKKIKFVGWSGDVSSYSG